jgi:hypothetical protein
MDDNVGRNGADQPLDEDEEEFRRARRVQVAQQPPSTRPKVPSRAQHLDRHIGCPLSWLKRVYPVARSKGDIVVWLWLWRLRSVRRSRTVAVSNNGLAELGIDRYAKYRSLKRFAKAGLIAMGSRDGRAVTVTFRA